MSEVLLNKSFNDPEVRLLDLLEILEKDPPFAFEIMASQGMVT